MSDADRVKWDERYSAGAYSERPHPSAFLADCADRLPRRGRALDLACGTGRNAIFLARRGLTVDAVDISKVALERARGRAGSLPIRWLQRDLERGLQTVGSFEAVVNTRYVNLPLLRSLLPTLAPGGVLIVEQHLAYDGPQDVVGPRNPAFRLAPGQLGELALALCIERLEEGVFADHDGRVAALARLVARRPPAAATAIDGDRGSIAKAASG